MTRHLTRHNTTLLGCAVLLAVITMRPAHATPAATVNTADPKIQAEAAEAARKPPVLPPPGRVIAEDPSGRREIGKASVYSQKFQGRHMANGERFHHAGSAAASRTLPIGTQAKVTNVQTGRSAVVTVQDRGPFVDGRTVDLSRSTAQQLGITKKDGVAPVEVAPIAVPQKDGTVKAGAGALNATK